MPAWGHRAVGLLHHGQGHGGLVKESLDNNFIEIWRCFQISDHLYYMYTAIDTNSLEFHKNRGDFEEWEVWLTKQEISRLDEICHSKLKGEPLRTALTQAAERNFVVYSEKTKELGYY